jgi:membrane-associated phospholipid phosphatase
MTSLVHHRRAFVLRLEDAIALLFFLFYLVVLSLFGSHHAGHLGPASQMILVGIMALFLKEVFHQAFSGREYRMGDPGQWREFAHPYWEIIRDWFPFLIILVMYYSLYGDATHLLIHRDRDAFLIGLDQRLFGFQASVALQRFITPSFTSWMKFSYGMHLLYIPLVAGFLYARRPRECFRNMMCGLVTVCLFGFLGYLFVPAVGPMFALRSQYTVPLIQHNALIGRQAAFMDFARIQRDAFPSMHVGISFLILLYAGWNSRKLFWILSPFVISLWISTVYLRYHYLADCVAGLILAPLCFLLANWLFARFNEISFSVPWPEFARLPYGNSAGLNPASGLNHSAARNPELP